MKARSNKPSLAWIGVTIGACWFLFGCATTSGGSNDKTSGQEPPKVFVAPTPAPVAPVPAPSQQPAPNQQSAAAASSTKPPPAPPPSAPPKASATELEKLVMPIALHPDQLISIILPAAVYPLEIVQAARFVRDTNNIPKVDEQSWDENVKAVAKFPELIAKLDADLDWTMKLGQAFLDQPKELMDTIQDLRAKAQKAGTLRSSPQQIVTVTNVVVIETNYTQVVTVTNQIVQVAPANPQVVYVPTYPPTVYYPPPTYVYDPVTPLVTFGIGMAWGAIIANNCDWHHGGVYYGHGDVDIDVDRTVNRGDRTVNRGDRPAQQGNRAANSGARPTQQKWQPNQDRLRSSGAPSAGTREARGWGGGSTRPTTGARPSTGAVGTRPSSGNVAARPSSGMSSGNRASASPSVSQRSSSRPSSNSYARSSGSSGSAFGGMSSGSSARSYSNRGSSSRSGGFGGSGGSRGGRGGRGR
ncbi:MAG TPA: DUF3300 domain-containing protein [Candidatus Limnocylindrales bacterium]|nr:DUF3300 domain-containing protein [Candidatus Limnocylindrales bacterium]